jgi:prepilin-type processing-associated H-X9-DG protein
MVRKSFRFNVRKAMTVVMGSAMLMAAIPATTVSAAGINDYPYRGTANRLDPWGFYTGYCTSFVAFRLSQEGVRFHGASLTGPNGRTAFFGNGGSWDAAARSIGYTVDSHPSVGSVAVWHGGENYAWWGGHVAYVMAVDASGQAVVEEYNWSHYLGYGTRTTQAPRYIHFVAGHSVTPPAPAPAPAPSGAHLYRVTDVVRQRSGPGTSYATLGFLQNGQQISIACQVRSASTINGTSIWDRLTNGSYVTDYYTTTPAFNAFSPGLPHC